MRRARAGYRSPACADSRRTRRARKPPAAGQHERERGESAEQGGDCRRSLPFPASRSYVAHRRARLWLAGRRPARCAQSASDRDAQACYLTPPCTLHMERRRPARDSRAAGVAGRPGGGVEAGVSVAYAARCECIRVMANVVVHRAATFTSGPTPHGAPASANSYLDHVRATRANDLSSRSPGEHRRC